MARQSPPVGKAASSHARTKRLIRVGGLPAVAALFAVAPERVEKLYFEERVASAVDGFCLALGRMRRPYRRVEADELARIAGTILHGGIVALAQPRPLPPFDVAGAAEWARTEPLLLMLDGVGNPHNLGAIVRTAAFFGVPRIVLSDHPAQAGPSDASYRVAEGGMEFIELYRASRFARMLRDLRRSYRVIAAAAQNGQPVATLTPDARPIALILGNEERGLPHTTMEACDAVVTISGSGRIESLNVSATAAILLHAFGGDQPLGRPRGIRQ